MKNKSIPGTIINYADEKHAFNAFKNMIDMGDGITLSQVCNITGLDGFLIQNWVKRGFIARPVNKKYYSKQFARILLINSLKDSLQIEEIGQILTFINGDVEDESDDLLSEEELYNIFSAIIYDLENINDVDFVIKNNCKNQKPKLKEAMTMMVYAYYSSMLKKKAYIQFNKLKEARDE